MAHSTCHSRRVTPHPPARCAPQVGWLVRQASHLRAWVAGSLRDLTAGLPAGLGPGGLLEPVPARIVVGGVGGGGREGNGVWELQHVGRST